jgi:catechol 2,3-dioxygenase-like lactoylglutathione lyase family enzyme
MYMHIKIFLLGAFCIYLQNKQEPQISKQSIMDQRLTIITLGVRDVRKATSFYENVFGWKKTASSNKDISFFHLNGMELALFDKTALAEDARVSPVGKGFKNFTLAYNAKSATEVDSLFATLTAKGAKPLKKPEKTSWGGYSCYIADPDDNLWEIAHNPFLPLDEKGNTTGS